MAEEPVPSTDPPPGADKAVASNNENSTANSSNNPAEAPINSAARGESDSGVNKTQDPSGNTGSRASNPPSQATYSSIASSKSAKKWPNQSSAYTTGLTDAPQQLVERLSAEQAARPKGNLDAYQIVFASNAANTATSNGGMHLIKQSIFESRDQALKRLEKEYGFTSAPVMREDPNLVKTIPWLTYAALQRLDINCDDQTSFEKTSQGKQSPFVFLFQGFKFYFDSNEQTNDSIANQAKTWVQSQTFNHPDGPFTLKSKAFDDSNQTILFMLKIGYEKSHHTVVSKFFEGLDYEYVVAPELVGATNSIYMLVNFKKTNKFFPPKFIRGIDATLTVLSKAFYCFNCRSTEHLSKSCSVFCGNCIKFGHTASNCHSNAATIKKNVSKVKKQQNKADALQESRDEVLHKMVTAGLVSINFAKPKKQSGSLVDKEGFQSVQRGRGSNPKISNGQRVGNSPTKAAYALKATKYGYNALLHVNESNDLLPHYSDSEHEYDTAIPSRAGSPSKRARSPTKRPRKTTPNNNFDFSFKPPTVMAKASNNAASANSPNPPPVSDVFSSSITGNSDSPQEENTETVTEQSLDGTSKSQSHVSASDELNGETSKDLAAEPPQQDSLNTQDSAMDMDSVPTPISH